MKVTFVVQAVVSPNAKTPRIWIACSGDGYQEELSEAVVQRQLLAVWRSHLKKMHPAQLDS